MRLVADYNAAAPNERLQGVQLDIEPYVMLRQLPEAYILVMADRNFASGPDGSIEHVRGEFDYASRIGAACGIVVGQEFGSFRSSAACRLTT